MLQDGAWLQHARHANAMAKRLEAAIRGVPGVELAYAVESNGVFARIPPRIVEGLHARGWRFYTGVVTPDESRLMCSWDTTAEDVDLFAKDMRELAQ